MIVASAPGKLMIAGEYAVADRASPALAVAVDRRVRVRVEPGDGEWVVSSSDVGLRRAEAKMVPAVAAAVARVGSARRGGGHIVIESDLGSGPNKPGLGASAAITVATLGALRAAAGDPAPSVREVVACHRESQGGRGSGYDVATALVGGVVVYEPRGRKARRIHWPRGLHAAVLHTGRGASTTAHLGRLAAARSAMPDDYREVVEGLALRAQAVVEAFEAGDVAGVLVGSEKLEWALADLDAVCGIGIGQGGQRELRETIEGAGAVARTSGAGGGDCLWALSDSPEKVVAAVRAAHKAGFRMLELRWPGDGLSVTTI